MICRKCDRETTSLGPWGVCDRCAKVERLMCDTHCEHYCACLMTRETDGIRLETPSRCHMFKRKETRMQ